MHKRTELLDNTVMHPKCFNSIGSNLKNRALQNMKRKKFSLPILPFPIIKRIGRPNITFVRRIRIPNSSYTTTPVLSSLKI